MLYLRVCLCPWLLWGVVLAGTPVLTLEGSGWSLGTSHGLELPTCEPWGGSADLNPECRKMQKGFIEQSCSKFRQQRKEGGIGERTKHPKDLFVFTVPPESGCWYKHFPPSQGHLCFHGQVTKRFYVIPQRLFSQQDTSCKN